MGSIFKFKEFEVNQSGCAMKINTDGVLLGAMVVQERPEYILDIGTGTGVIAMMLAQRFPEAQVDAVEIDESAANAAINNFANSKFATRNKAHLSPIADYQTTKKYDLIVSNPPFFVNDLKNPETRKGIARHADEEFFESLVQKANEILTDKGSFWLILPVKQAELLVESAASYGLSLQRRIAVCSDQSRPVIRHIICLSKQKTAPSTSETFYIYESKGVHTPAYKTLLKDFFLAF
ncbi:methyltransferase [Pedobacter sp. N36a]|uniref:tRNA1(Val) (adenine(37)-N6)-methyltransferase n=1 Tax=Pedobacter sp. N36a TaxID=2767996 RepID=UPI001656A109|nr:methyltransferase [Pedobacter sp. N36a]MBC8986704.1 methyltransferase [Pedobacter sp. N36a]